MEQYGLDALAASADAVVAGLGPVTVMLARLAVEAGQAVTLEDMELLASEQGREILRGVLQLSLEAAGRRGGAAGGGDRRGRGAAGSRGA